MQERNCGLKRLQLFDLLLTVRHDGYTWKCFHHSPETNGKARTCLQLGIDIDIFRVSQDTRLYNGTDEENYRYIREAEMEMQTAKTIKEKQRLICNTQIYIAPLG